MPPPRPSLPRAVIFDWDNTLIDNWGAIADSLNVTRTAFGMATWTESEVRTRCTRALRDSFPEWFGEEWKRAEELYRGHFMGIHLQKLNVLPGVVDLLDLLRTREIPLFVVSNKLGNLLRREAEHLGWTNRFVTLVGSQDAPRDKPERDPVDVALSHGDLKADDPNIWFVGDTHVDIACARAAGCTPIMVHNPDEAKRLNLDLSFSDCVALREWVIF